MSKFLKIVSIISLCALSENTHSMVRQLTRKMMPAAIVSATSCRSMTSSTPMLQNHKPHDLLITPDFNAEISQAAKEKAFKSATSFYDRWNINYEIIKDLLNSGISEELKAEALKAAIKKNNFKGIRLIDPLYFANKLPDQKKLITNAPDLTQNQKTIILDLYEKVTINPNIDQKTYLISPEQKQQIIDLKLTIIQLATYFPQTMFETKLLLPPHQQTRTAYMIINWISSVLEFSPFEFKCQIVPFEQYKRINSLPDEFHIEKWGIFDRMIQIEHEMEQCEYETFVTGRSWEHNFYNDVWNMLQALAHKQEAICQTVHLAHYDKRDTIEYLRDQRACVIKNGSKHPLDGICLNRSLLANHKQHGWSSMERFARNVSDSTHPAYGSCKQAQQLRRLFTLAGMQQHADQYIPQLEQLQKTHKATSQFGEILAISIDKNHLDSLLYLAEDSTKPASCNDLPSQALQKFNEQEFNHDTYEGYDYNGRTNFYYFFAMPDIAAENGTIYKVESIHLADPAKYEAYKEKRDALFETMKKELEI